MANQADTKAPRRIGAEPGSAPAGVDFDPHRMPTATDMAAARQRLKGVAVVTPLIASPVLDEIAGGRVFLKAEVLQRTGSFKFRGAFNRISLIPEARRSAGVVACSSGNHAQGVAEAARIFKIPATIVMPEDAPAIKRARTERAGATVVTYRRNLDDREAIAHEIAARTGATFVHPYDDCGVIAGQGTVGLEIVDQTREAGVVPDQVLVPASGGGLTAGIAIAIADALPDTRVFTVEPEDFDDHARSLEAGERLSNALATGSIADALMSRQPGALTFAINRARLAGGFGVSDAAILQAVAFAAEELKLAVEPGGAVALAAVLDGLVATKGRVTVVVMSGGNLDPAMLARALGEAHPRGGVDWGPIRPGRGET